MTQGFKYFMVFPSQSTAEEKWTVTESVRNRLSFVSRAPIGNLTKMYEQQHIWIPTGIFDPSDLKEKDRTDTFAENERP